MCRDIENQPTWNPPIAMEAVTPTGGLLMYTVLAKEKMTRGNQIMKMMRTSNSPPTPYLMSEPFFCERGVG